MSGDSELLDFMDDNGVQIWPERTRPNKTMAWTAQLRSPFMQISRPTLRMAVRELMEKAKSNERNSVEQTV